MNKILRVLRVVLLIWCPIATFIVSFWIMEHDPFEEVVRTAFAILFIINMSFMYVSIFDLKMGKDKGEWER